MGSTEKLRAYTDGSRREGHPREDRAGEHDHHDDDRHRHGSGRHQRCAVHVADAPESDDDGTVDRPAYRDLW